MSDRSDNRGRALIEASGISVRFGSTQALDKMPFRVSPGEVVGLIGANGAGKSTLMKVITGVYRQDEGTLRVGEETIRPEDSYTAGAARAGGIYCAYQELSCCTNLKVFENFLLNTMDHTPFSKFGWRKRARDETRQILDTVFPQNGIHINALVDGLPMAQRQMIEICKAIHQQGLKVLVLDEPTAYLPGERIAQLHAYLRVLVQTGVAVIYISHKLDEIQQICDRVTIMKNGRCECEKPVGEITKDEMIGYLGGGERQASGHCGGEETARPVLLSIKGLNTPDLHDIRMEIRKGEILGVSGLDGSGQSELLQTLFDRIFTKKLKGAKDLSIAYVSGNRAKEGVLPYWNISKNISAASLTKISAHGVLRPRDAEAFSQGWFDKLEVKADSPRDEIVSLSGGNQQKVLIARGLATGADIILLNDPTCGVDIGTKQEIYRFMHAAKAEGKTVILFSTEDYEMCECERVYVMHEGAIVAQLQGGEISEANIVRTAFAWKSGGEAEGASGKVLRKSLPAWLAGGLGSLARNNRAFIAVCTFLILYAVVAALKPVALSYRGVNLLFSATAPLVLVALSQMFIAIGGGMDMSNGMAVGLVNVAATCIVSASPAAGSLMLLGMVIAYGLMGAFIYATRIPPVIVTLGMSFIWRGFSLIISPTPGGASPGWVHALFRFEIPGFLTSTLVVALAALLLAQWIVKWSKYGIVMSAVGNNPEVARRAGWSTLMATVSSYALSGLFVVLSGLSLTAITGSGDYLSGETYPLTSIAIFILGGCEFIGAFSSPLGVVVAAFAMSSISTLLTFAKINSDYSMLFTGLVLVLAQTTVMTTGNGAIDISIFYVVSFAPYLLQFMSERLGFALGFAATLLLCAALGLLNGLITYYLNVPAMITTLATGYMIYSLTIILSGQVAGVPHGIVAFLANGRIFGVRWRVILTLLLIGLMCFVMYRTTYGWKLHAVGQNRVAARFAAIRVPAVVLTAFMISSVLAAVSGILLNGHLGLAGQDTGNTYMLPCMAATIIGGTNVSGGRSSIAGGALAGVMWTMLNALLNMSPLSTSYKYLLQGVALILVLVAAIQKKQVNK